MALHPGDTLERYVIEGALGEGGMGVVYRARDTRLNRRVALKVLHDGPVTAAGVSTGGSARILREARTAAMLEHPNVVATYDVGEITEGPHAGTAYLAMELVDGRSLRGYVGDISIPIVTRVRWLADVARGLGAAHERSLVHRDMKPENVIVRTDGTVKVLDFGIAKHSFAPLDAVSGAALELRTLTGEGVVVGTPLYMAPEQMRGSHVDAKADQFAWGVVAYELLTGELPWGARLDAISLVAAVLSNDPVDPCVKNPALPPWLARVVLRALAKSPADRYPTMRDVVAALDATDVATAPTQLAPVESMRVPPVATNPSVGGAVAGTVRTSPAGRRRGRTALTIGALAVVGLGAIVARDQLERRRDARSGSAIDASDAKSAPPRNGCASAVACTKALGAPAICRAADGACVALASPDCTVHADDVALKSDDTIWFGGLYATTGEDAPSGTIALHGADLARQDLADAYVALRTGTRHARPIGLVTCDDVADAHRAARHLVEDLRVPAVIDSEFSNPVVVVVSSDLAPAHVIDIATTATGPQVTQVPHADSPPWVWRTSNNGAESSIALARLVETRLEPQLRKEGIARTRVAVVRIKGPDPTQLGLSERFFESLHFNGRSALENGDDYREFAVEDHGDDTAAYAADVAGVVGFAPHVILGLGLPFYRHVMGPLERGWRAPAHRPWYLLGSLIGDEAFDLMGSSADLRRRVLGLGLTATTGANARFTMRYNEAFKENLSRADAPSTDYDAFYVLAYASYALGESSPTGPNLARAIKQLVPPGPTVDVGPTGILQAFTHLSAGQSIDLNGAGGNLDFDLSTGEQNADLAIMCAEVDASGKAAGNVESGLVYIARTDTLSGTLHCP